MSSHHKRTKKYSASLDLLAHMQPHVRISPFSPIKFEEVLKASALRPGRDVNRPNLWLKDGQDIKFFDSGRSAILAALKEQGLKQQDEVLIITTTQGTYISSCVTQTIEKVCRWTRKLSPRTRMALVIHEFGFPCEAKEIALCQEKNIPIIEDCAYALGSRMKGANVGTFGDFAIYSFTKHYPIPFGGILVSKKKLSQTSDANVLVTQDRALLVKFLRRAIVKQKDWDQKRRKNWEFFTRRLAASGLKPYFSLSSRVIPGAFIFQLPRKWNGALRKQTLVSAGVEATEYYHMGGFYFPVHQFLTDFEKEYITHHFLKTMRLKRHE